MMMMIMWRQLDLIIMQILTWPRRICSITPPEGGFFLWLKVDDDIDFVQRLMAEQAVRALPGSFMAVTDRCGQSGQWLCAVGTGA